MSAADQPSPKTESEQSQNFGSRIVKKLSKRMSSHSGSKEGASHETTGGNGVGQQALEKGEEVKDQITQGNISGVKDVATGENTKNASNPSDAAGAAGGVGSNRESVSQNKAEEASPRRSGHRRSVSRVEYNDDIKKGPMYKGPGRTSGGAGDVNTGTGTAIGSGAPLTGASTDMGRPGYSAAESGIDQRDTGQARLASGEGSSSQGGLTQPVSRKQNISFSDESPRVNTAGSDIAGQSAATGGIVGGLAGRGSAGAKSTESSIGQELEEQGHIQSDVFSSAASNEAAARGLSGSKDATEATHAPKNYPSKSKSEKISQPLQQGGTSQEAFGQGATKTGQSSKGLSSMGGSGLGTMGVGTMGAGLMGARGGLEQDAKQGDLRQSAYPRGDTNVISTTTGTASGVQSTRAVKNLNGGSYKVTVLQERVQAVTQKCKNQLGLSASEISKRSPTVDAFFDAVAAERLRWMPRDGSRLDCSLRWASRLAYAVDALRESIGAFAPGADEAAKLIWGFEILLLEVNYYTTKER